MLTGVWGRVSSASLETSSRTRRVYACASQLPIIRGELQTTFHILLRSGIICIRQSINFHTRQRIMLSERVEIRRAERVLATKVSLDLHIKIQRATKRAHVVVVHVSHARAHPATRFIELRSFHCVRYIWATTFLGSPRTLPKVLSGVVVSLARSDAMTDNRRARDG